MNKVSLVDTLLELIIPNGGMSSQIGEVGIHIKHWFDAIFLPSIQHLVPVWVCLLIKLPIPKKSNALWDADGAHPILHPNSLDRDTLLLEISVIFLHLVFSALKSNNCSLLSPTWKWLLSSDKVSDTRDNFFHRIANNDIQIELCGFP